LDLLQWVRQQRCPWNEIPFHPRGKIAQNGHWHLLQWALQNGASSWNHHTPMLNGLPGQYQARQWLTQKFSWTEESTQWTDAVTNVLEDVLDPLLCRDVCHLVKYYV